MPTDRRTRRTQSALYQALYELMQSKSVSRISVTELCERADVTRNTFYAHYRYPEDILQQIADDYIEALKRCIDQSYGAERLVNLLTYFKANSTQLELLTSDNCGLDIAKKIYAYPMENNLKKMAKEGVPLNDNYKKMISAFDVYGSAEIIKMWTRNGMKEHPEEIAQLIITLCEQGREGIYTPAKS